VAVLRIGDADGSAALRGAEVREPNEGVRLTDEQRLDWLRLIRSSNVIAKSMLYLQMSNLCPISGGYTKAAAAFSGHEGNQMWAGVEAAPCGLLRGSAGIPR